MDYNGLTVLASSAADSAVIGTGTFLLTDKRDDKGYLVRRLADGNCWMVQNLDLNLADFTSNESKRLTPDNTDVTETWIPGGDTLENNQQHQFQPKGALGENYYWGSNYVQGKGIASDTQEILVQLDLILMESHSTNQITASLNKLLVFFHMLVKSQTPGVICCISVITFPVRLLSGTVVVTVSLLTVVVT